MLHTLSWSSQVICTNLTCRVCSIQNLICQDESVEEGPMTVGPFGSEDFAKHISCARWLQLNCKVCATVVNPVLWLQLLQDPNNPANMIHSLS